MSKLVNFSIVFIALVIFVFVMKTLQSFVRPLVIAIILTLLLMPLLRYFEARKIPFLVTFSGIILLSILAIVVAIMLLVQNIAAINESLPEQQQKMERFIEDFEARLAGFSLFGDALSLQQFIGPEKASKYVSSALGTMLKGAQLILNEIFIIFLFMLFLIPSYKHFLKDIEHHVGQQESLKVKQVLLEIEQGSKDYLVTKTILSLGTALASIIVLFFFKSDLLLLLGILIFLLNFIPNIGSIIAVLIALFTYLLSYGFGWPLVFLAIFLILIQVIFDNILGPRITGHKLKLSPFIIILGLFFWGWTWGIVGMFLAVPLMSIIKIVLEHIESTKKIAKFMD